MMIKFPKIYKTILVTVLLWLSSEYLRLNQIASTPSILYSLSQTELFSEWNFSPAPGKPLSYYLGIIGFSCFTILLTYSARKRLGWFQKIGTSNKWINFHAFMGLLGATFIIFHTNLKVGGVVAFAFWSMIIAVMSGIVGRYIYAQVVHDKQYWTHHLKVYEENFIKFKEHYALEENDVDDFKKKAIEATGGDKFSQENNISAPFLVLLSMKFDLMLRFKKPEILPEKFGGMNQRFLEYGVIVRKKKLLDKFQKIMGYWHAFHMPFSILMYSMSVLHIINVYIFGVN